MPEVLRCPQCNAPLSPGKFARQVVCSFCGTQVQVDPSAVSARRYREAFAEWNSPAAHGHSRWFSVGEQHFTAERLIAHGEICDVYRAERARWPSDTVLIKVLRDAADAPLLDNEWRVLSALEPEAEAAHIPGVLFRGTLSGPLKPGAQAAVFRWPIGERSTFEEVRARHPHGIEPVASIWVWRRILEMLTLVHRAGFVHGAVLPQHLLVRRGEHGVRTVGFSCADAPGARLRAVCTPFEAYYPPALLDRATLAPEHDAAMSARCVAYLLGGNPDGSVPSSVPGPLAESIQATAQKGARDPWALREELGELGRSLFGPPSFHPIP